MAVEAKHTHTNTQIELKAKFFDFSRRETITIRGFEWSFSKSLLNEREILAFSYDGNNIHTHPDTHTQTLSHTLTHTHLLS